MGERTRDKMAAARRKGKWTGGTPVLGYDVDPHGGRLVANETEAGGCARFSGCTNATARFRPY